MNSINKVMDKFIPLFESSIIYVNLNVYNSKTSAIELNTPEYDLQVYYSSFSFCYSKNAASAIKSLIKNCVIKKLCAVNCTSEVNEQPEGALLYIYNDVVNDNNITLDMVTYTNTPDNKGTYSAVSLYNGTTNINNINSSKNIASSCPLLYVRCDVAKKSFGSHINSVGCWSINTLFFNDIGTYSYSYMNIINNTCKSQTNGLIRTYGDLTIHNSIFLNNFGNLLIAVTQDSKISFDECYFDDITLTGSGQMITGNSIENSQTIRMSVIRCAISLKCTLLQNHKTLLLNRISIFILNILLK